MAATLLQRDRHAQLEAAKSQAKNQAKSQVESQTASKACLRLRVDGDIGVRAAHFPRSSVAKSAEFLHVWMRQQRAQRTGTARHLDPWQRQAAHKVQGKRRCGRSWLLAEDARLAGKGGTESEYGVEAKEKDAFW